jgi:hypothetical protein
MADDEEIDPISKEEWNAIRETLKAGILAGEIPVNTKVMPPKALYEQYLKANHPAFIFHYADIKARDKYTRILRNLRKKHMDGDLENENKSTKPIEWGKSAAKQFLKKCFRDGTLVCEFTEKHEIEEIWNRHCKDHIAFKRMEFDDAFVRRIKSVRDDFVKKETRCANDLLAYSVAKKNHPTPTHNSRGEPQWNGSAAQKLLKEIVARGDHVGIAPSDLREATKYHGIFLVYSKETFRDHIYQEERLLKFEKYLTHLKRQKLDSLQY